MTIANENKQKFEPNDNMFPDYQVSEVIEFNINLDSIYNAGDINHENGMPQQVTQPAANGNVFRGAVESLNIKQH